MAGMKYSRQRELIKQYLASTSSHPTADMVYDEIRRLIPNISLATVYRWKHLASLPFYLYCLRNRLGFGDGFHRLCKRMRRQAFYWYDRGKCHLFLWHLPLLPDRHRA